MALLSWRRIDSLSIAQQKVVFSFKKNALHISNPLLILYYQILQWCCVNFLCYFILAFLFCCCCQRGSDSGYEQIWQSLSPRTNKLQKMQEAECFHFRSRGLVCRPPLGCALGSFRLTRFFPSSVAAVLTSTAPSIICWFFITIGFPPR